MALVLGLLQRCDQRVQRASGSDCGRKAPRLLVEAACFDLKGHPLSLHGIA